MPSVTPVYNNNPCFAILSLNENDLSIESLIFSFLLLEKYQELNEFIWDFYEPSIVFDFDLNYA